MVYVYIKFIVAMLIQVAGINSYRDLKTVNDCGVSMVGLPYVLDYHSEDMPIEEAIDILKYFPSIKPVLITYSANYEEIEYYILALAAKFVQLHGDVNIELIERIKENFPNIKIIKSLIIGKKTEFEIFDDIILYQQYCNFFITDTYDSVTGAIGATGKTHDWRISAKIVKFSKIPIILAGGISHKNVYDAILKVKPAGVDSHTGLEDEQGNKSSTKIKKFIIEIFRAENLLNLNPEFRKK